MNPALRTIAVGIVAGCLCVVASCRLDKLGTGEISPIDDAGLDAPDGPSPPEDATPDQNDAFEDAPTDVADADAAMEAEAEACVPVTCTQLNALCGTPSDGCGELLSCGACSAEQGCHDGRCVVVRFVVEGGAGAQDGTSWDNAFSSVQAAVDVAQAGEEVWVGAGTYLPRSPGIPVVTLKQGNAVYGGFVGTEENRSDRDPSAAIETVLDGNDAAKVVVGASDVLLEGLVIRSGRAADNGGGLWAVNAAALQIEGCKFEQNNAVVHGGGLYALLSSVTIARSVFEGNTARQGGGVFNDHSTFTIHSSVFYGNKVDNSQGGGGGLFNYDGPATVTNSVFLRNSATPYYGGAVYNWGAQSYRYINCTFHENTADQSGGAVFDNLGAKPAVLNCILWGNSPDQLYDWPGSGPADVRYSDVQGSIDGGVGNLDTPPGFEDPLSGKLGLVPGSPCIDSANGDDAPASDGLGLPRRDDPATPNTGAGTPNYVDMGAYEYQP